MNGRGQRESEMEVQVVFINRVLIASMTASQMLRQVRVHSEPLDQIFVSVRNDPRSQYQDERYHPCQASQKAVPIDRR